MKGSSSVLKVPNTLRLLNISLQAIRLYRDYLRKRILEGIKNDRENHIMELLERTEIK